MDPTTMAAIAAGVFATKALEETGSQAGRELSAAAGRLVAWLRRSGAEDIETGAALTIVEADPGDQSRVDLLGKILAARVAADHHLEQQLQEHVTDVQQAGDIQLIVGGAHIHGSVSGGTVTQVGRDQYRLLFDSE